MLRPSHTAYMWTNRICQLAQVTGSLSQRAANAARLTVSSPLHNYDSSYAVPAVSLDACGAQILCRGLTTLLHSSCSFLLFVSLVTVSR